MKCTTDKKNHIRLYREVNKRVRYYFLSIYVTLFDSFILEIKYGSKKNLRPTGIQVEHFSDIDSAYTAMEKAIATKCKKGYREESG